jgi:hypothetical protein
MKWLRRLPAAVLASIIATQWACTLTAVGDPDTPIPPATQAENMPASATTTVEPTAKSPGSATPAATEAPPPTATATPTEVADAGPACQIAYVRDGQLYCRLTDAREVQMAIVDGGSVQRIAIATDGQSVAYTIGVPGGPADLFAIGLEAALAGELVPISLANATTLSGGRPDDVVSPSEIAFMAGQDVVVFDTSFVPVGGIEGPGEYVNNDLWRVNADGSALTAVLAIGQGGRFSVSPAGAQIAISSATAISVLDLVSGSQTVALEYDPILTYSEYSWRPALTWRADGTEFAAVVPSTDPLAEDTNATLHLISADGIEQPLGLVPGNFVFGGMIDLTADGSRVAFSLRDDSGQANEARVRQVEGGAAEEVILLPEIQWLRWSPDGQQLLVVHRNVTGNGMLFSVGDGSLRSLDLPVRDAIWRGPDLYYLIENGDGSFDINRLSAAGVEVLLTAIDSSLWAVR